MGFVASYAFWGAGGRCYSIVVAQLERADLVAHVIMLSLLLDATPGRVAYGQPRDRGCWRPPHLAGFEGAGSRCRRRDHPHREEEQPGVCQLSLSGSASRHVAEVAERVRRGIQSLRLCQALAAEVILSLLPIVPHADDGGAETNRRAKSDLCLHRAVMHLAGRTCFSMDNRRSASLFVCASKCVRAGG
jgi:hypothetical protein